MRPLDHLLVVDLTAGRSGPTAVRQLGDWGARVIRVERPAGPEAIVGHRDGGDFQNLHRNVECITLDLKHPDGRALLLELVDRADVLVENFRPGVTERLGIDHEAVQARNPRLIYGSISGFGRAGPYRDRPGLDQVVQGMSGLMSVTGLPGQGPVRAGIAVADSGAGLYLALGLLTALVARERTGRGEWVRTSLLESMVALLDFQAARWLVEGDAPVQEGNDHPTVAPMGVYPTADGHVTIAAGGNAMFGALCTALGCPEVADDERFVTMAGRSAGRVELNAELRRRTVTRTSADWIEVLNAAGVPCGPILTIPEALEDPQVLGMGLRRPVDHPTRGRVDLVGQPVTFADGDRGVRGPAPARGTHTDAVLRELGHDDGAIAAWRAAGVI